MTRSLQCGPGDGRPLVAHMRIFHNCVNWVSQAATPEIIGCRRRLACGQLDLQQQTLATRSILRLLRQPEHRTSEGHDAQWHREAHAVVPA